jgi:hypothetical protein
MEYWPPPMVYWTSSNSISNPLPTAFWTPYPWYFDSLSIVYQTTQIINYELCNTAMEYWLPSHGILKPLPMLLRSPYPWYFDPSTME